MAGYRRRHDVAIESAGVALASDDIGSLVSVITVSAVRYRTIGSWCGPAKR
jgi:cation transport ATPase